MIRNGLPPTNNDLRLEIERQLSIARRYPTKATVARSEAKRLIARLESRGEQFANRIVSPKKDTIPTLPRLKVDPPVPGGPGILRSYIGNPLPALTNDEVIITGVFKTVARPNRDWKGE